MEAQGVIQTFSNDARTVPQFNGQPETCFIGGSWRGLGVMEAKADSTQREEKTQLGFHGDLNLCSAVDTVKRYPVTATAGFFLWLRPVARFDRFRVNSILRVQIHMINRVSIEAAIWRLAGWFKPGSGTPGDLSAETLRYLFKDNPKLVALKRRYLTAAMPEHSSWESMEDKLDLLRFRGENDYLSQAYFRKTLLRYQMTAAYVEMLDKDDWLHSLTEDVLFGVKTWDVLPGVTVTRDLLDSIIEIHFLKDKLGLGLNDSVKVLDIGAGYGRFAHRFTNIFKQSHVSCTDAIATSTFLSQFYLNHRGCADQTKVVPFDQLSGLKAGSIDFALNIHSWTECSSNFVGFWLAMLADLKVPYLFIVPHFGDFSTKELNGSRGDYTPELEKHGYKLMLKERKFARSKIIDRNGVFPADYFIFKRG